jgi:hypothetical protein
MNCLMAAIFTRDANMQWPFAAKHHLSLSTWEVFIACGAICDKAVRFTTNIFFQGANTHWKHCSQLVI